MTKRIGWLGIPVSLAFWTVPFMVAFLAWFVTGESRNQFRLGADGSLSWTMVLAASWIFLGPVLMFVGEVGFGSTLSELQRTRDDHWETDRLSELVRKINAAALPTDLAFIALVVFAYVEGNTWLQENLAVGSVGSITWFLGLLVLIQIGFSSGLGSWGAAKAVLFARAATRMSQLPPWAPFRPDQAPGVEALAFFGTSTAVLFSIGSVLAPAIAIVASSLSGLAAVALWISVAVLIAGSTALFLVPTFFVRRLANAQRSEVLTSLAVQIESTGPRLFNDRNALTEEEADRLALQLEYWRLINESSAHPRNVEILRRLPATTLLPVLSALGTYVALFVSGK